MTAKPTVPDGLQFGSDAYHKKMEELILKDDVPSHLLRELNPFNMMEQPHQILNQESPFSDTDVCDSETDLFSPM